MREEVIVKIINEKGVEAYVKEVRKGDTILNGIVLGNGTIRPTVYLEDYNGTDEEIAEKMIEVYIKSKIDSFDINQISDYQQVKNKLQICLRQPTNNDAEVKRQYLDMEMYIRIMLEEFNNVGKASCIVTKQLIENWEISEDEVFNDAIENSKGKLQIKNILDVLKGMVGADDFEVLDDNPVQMYVSSNKEMTYGSYCFIDLDFLAKISDKFCKNIYIIPSSIHETLIIPDDDNVNPEELAVMIKSVNSTEVKLNEILSDHAYYYDRNTNAVTCC